MQDAKGMLAWRVGLAQRQRAVPPGQTSARGCRRELARRMQIAISWGSRSRTYAVPIGHQAWVGRTAAADAAAIKADGRVIPVDIGGSEQISGVALVLQHVSVGRALVRSWQSHGAIDVARYDETTMATLRRGESCELIACRYILRVYGERGLAATCTVVLSGAIVAPSYFEAIRGDTVPNWNLRRLEGEGGWRLVAAMAAAVLRHRRLTNPLSTVGRQDLEIAYGERFGARKAGFFTRHIESALTAFDLPETLGKGTQVQAMADYVLGKSLLTDEELDSLATGLSKQG